MKRYWTNEFRIAGSQGIRFLNYLGVVLLAETEEITTHLISIENTQIFFLILFQLCNAFPSASRIEQEKRSRKMETHAKPASSWFVSTNQKSLRGGVFEPIIPTCSLQE